MRRRLPLACAALWLAGAAAAQEYSFDVAAFEKKPLELGGRAELRAERVALDPDSALYRLNLYDRAAPAHLDRTAAVLELNGLYRAGSATFQATAHAESASDELDHEDRSRLYEAYVALEPETGTRLEAGKRVLRWGKGYAFNPVAFLERPKDPNDPELAREGFVILGAGVTRSLAGPLAAVSFTPVLVPTDDHINEDFGPGDHWNPGARLALLYRDTDIDLLALGAGARSARYGVAFARNLAPNLEIHGEWARITEASRPVLGPDGAVSTAVADATSYLLGLRHLSRHDVTTILEYYYNGAGYTEAQTRDFFAFVRRAHEAFLATGDAGALERARPATGLRAARAHAPLSLPALELEGAVRYALLHAGAHAHRQSRRPQLLGGAGAAVYRGNRSRAAPAAVPAARRAAHGVRRETERAPPRAAPALLLLRRRLCLGPASVR